MGTGPQDSTTSVSLPRCCLPVPARFFQHHSASISDQAPVVSSHGKERQPPGSSRGNRIVQLSRNADDYRLHFPFVISHNFSFVIFCLCLDWGLVLSRPAEKSAF